MWSWIKIPKGVALLAFLLPWMTVKCSGQELVHATGFGLTFGRFTAVSEKAGSGDQTLNYWLILALVAILAGLVICFIKGREAAKIVLGTSAAAFALILVGTMKYSKSAIADKMNESSDTAGAMAGAGGAQEAQMREAMLGMIQIEWHMGYYLTLAALIAAAVMAFLVMRGKDAEAEARVREAAGKLGESARDFAAKAEDAAKSAVDKVEDAVKKDDDPPKA